MTTIELECHDCGLYEERNILPTEDPEQSTRSLMRRLDWVETEDGELCPGCADRIIRAQEADDRQARAYYDRQR